jgi:hypothetical protein
VKLLLFAVDPPELPELLRGRWAAPDWLILVLGGVVAVGAGVYLAVRHRREARR